MDFKLGFLVHKCPHGFAPTYLAEMLELQSDVPALRRLLSAAQGDFVVPRTQTRSIGPRSFAVTGPTFWNTLPNYFRDQTLTIAVFKQRLKTLLFSQHS